MAGGVTTIDWDAVPALTAGQMREVDRVMIEEMGIELLQMMENAGRGLAELALRRFGPRSAVVLAGSGGNGGGGLAGARHLGNRGVVVRVVLAQPAEKMSPAARAQLEVLRRMEVPIAEEPGPADLVIDALIGYSLRGDPQGRAAELIEWANDQQAPVLALDTPSGLDVTSGHPGSPCVEATVTLTLALPKTGLRSAPEVGELYLADISVPPSVYGGLGLAIPNLFGADQLVEIVRPE